MLRGILIFGIWVLDFTASTLAVSMPKLERIALGETLVVAAIRTEAGQGKIHALIELEFLRDDFKCRRASRRLRSASRPGGVGAVLARNNLGENFLINVLDVIGELRSLLGDLELPDHIKR